MASAPDITPFLKAWGRDNLRTALVRIRQSILDVIGEASVEAAVPADVATTDVFVPVFTHSNSRGLIGSGTIKNTGAQAIDVRETVTDRFGASDSSLVSVVAGDSLLLSTTQNLGAARPPYASYRVEVKSALPGMPGTYKLFFVSSNASV